MKKLKNKIFASFMLLVMMLALAGVISIVEFRWLINSLHGLVEDNYKSIEASKTMLEALEREDSGILLVLLGEMESGRKIFFAADSAFIAALSIAKNNLTEPNENAYIQSIDDNYLLYKNFWNKPLLQTDKEASILWYQNTVHHQFSETKRSINDLMNLNQSSMYENATHLRERSRRAMMPGIVAIISAVIFSFVLHFFINRYFVKPIIDLAMAVKAFRPEDKILRTKINSKDEIKQLEEAINHQLNSIVTK
jgi:methyl-accepting chemotaxis protein